MERSFKYLSVAPSLLCGIGAGSLAGGGRQQPVAMGGRNVGNGQEMGGVDCFTSSIIVTSFAPLSLMVASLSNTKTNCQPHKTNHFRCEEQTKHGEALPPMPQGGWAELTFQHPAPKTSVNDGVRGEESHAEGLLFHLANRTSGLTLYTH